MWDFKTFDFGWSSAGSLLDHPSNFKLTSNSIGPWITTLIPLHQVCGLSWWPWHELLWPWLNSWSNLKLWPKKDLWPWHPLIIHNTREAKATLDASLGQIVCVCVGRGEILWWHWNDLLWPGWTPGQNSKRDPKWPLTLTLTLAPIILERSMPTSGASLYWKPLTLTLAPIILERSRATSGASLYWKPLTLTLAPIILERSRATSGASLYWKPLTLTLAPIKLERSMATSGASLYWNSVPVGVFEIWWWPWNNLWWPQLNSCSNFKIWPTNDLWSWPWPPLIFNNASLVKVRAWISRFGGDLEMTSGDLGWTLL